MQNITVTMQHSPETIQRLSKVQYNTFHAKAKAFWYVAFCACILGGLGFFGALPSTGKVLLIAIGGIGIMNVGASARAKADKTIKLIQAHGNHFPVTQITVTPSKISILEEGMDKAKRLDKAKVLRVAEDEANVYIFINQEAAYMLPKDQAEDSQALVEAVERATGKSIQSPLQLKHITLKWLIHRRKK